MGQSDRMVDVQELKRMIQEDLASEKARIDALSSRVDDLENSLGRAGAERADILRRLAAVERSVLPAG